MNDPQPLPTDAEPCSCTNPWAHDQCIDAAGCKIKKKLRRTPALVGVEPVATVTCEGVMGVSFTSSSSYGCDLAVGTNLYTAEQVLAMGRVPLTRQQLREAFYNDTACTLGGDVDLAEKVCRVVEKAHGIKQGGQHGAE